MQRAKHADRKRETRTKIMIGEAVLAHYIETGGSKELRAFVTQHTTSPIRKLANGGSEATRRGDVGIEVSNRSESVPQ